jgi:hypothetical protein
MAGIQFVFVVHLIIPHLLFAVFYSIFSKSNRIRLVYDLSLENRGESTCR